MAVANAIWTTFWDGVMVVKYSKLEILKVFCNMCTNLYGWKFFCGPFIYVFLESHEFVIADI